MCRVMNNVFTKLSVIAIIVICLAGCTSQEKKDKALDIATNGTVLTKLSFLYYVGDDPESLARMLNVKEIKEDNLKSIANSNQKRINSLFQYYSDNYKYSDKASYIRVRSEFDPEWGFFSSVRYWRYLSPISFWIIIILICIFSNLIYQRILDD